MCLAVALAVLGAPPLEVEEVVQRALRYHPKTAIAEAKVEEARAKIVGSMGSFDTKLSLGAQTDPAGYYDKRKGKVALSQPLQTLGIDVEGGIRYGEDLPSYAGKDATSFGGEGYASLRFPLLRDRSIDMRRFGLKTAEIGLTLAQRRLDLALLELRADAATAYWKWVAAGQKVRIEERFLRIAAERQEAIRHQIENGSSPAILERDNMRLIVSRQGRVVVAERKLAEAALYLSLFLWEDESHAAVPARESLPDSIDIRSVAVDHELAKDRDSLLEARPDLRMLRQLRAQLSLQQSFGANLATPSADLRVEASRDVGERQRYGAGPNEITRNRTEVGLSLSFELPAQRRKGRGEMQAATAGLRRVDAEISYGLREAEVELERAHVVLNAARQSVELAQEAYALSLELEKAERKRFYLGQSNLLFVNTREEMSATAASELVEAKLAYRLSWLQYRLARGRW